MTKNSQTEIDNFQEIYERLLIATRAKNDAALSIELNVSPQSISQAKKKGKIPLQWITYIAENFTKYNVSADWLLFGRDNADMTALRQRIFDVQQKYSRAMERNERLKEELISRTQQSLGIRKHLADVLPKGSPATMAVERYLEQMIALPSFALSFDKLDNDPDIVKLIKDYHVKDVF